MGVLATPSVDFYYDIGFPAVREIPRDGPLAFFMELDASR